jgi:hypothetical protein
MALDLKMGFKETPGCVDNLLLAVTNILRREN